MKNVACKAEKHSRERLSIFSRVNRDLEIRTFSCAREPGNPHSSDAIIVKFSDGSNVGHVPDPLARVLAPMLDGGEIDRMEGTV